MRARCIACGEVTAMLEVMPDVNPSPPPLRGRPETPAATSSARRAALRRRGVGDAPMEPGVVRKLTPPRPPVAKPSPARPAARPASSTPRAASKTAAPRAAKPAPHPSASKPAAKPSIQAKPAKPAAKPSNEPKAAPMKGVMPKGDPGTIARMDALLAEFPAYRRSMFGTVSWFLDANAQMFAGVWGTDATVRVGVEEARRLIAAGTAQPFEPMPGRAMREYVLIPASTLRDAQLRRWLDRAAKFASGVAAKKLGK